MYHGHELQGRYTYGHWAVISVLTLLIALGLVFFAFFSLELVFPPKQTTGSPLPGASMCVFALFLTILAAIFWRLKNSRVSYPPMVAGFILGAIVTLLNGLYFLQNYLTTYAGWLASLGLLVVAITVTLYMARRAHSEE